MANLKDIKTRIAGVKKTRQITSAMKLVSAAKLAKASEAATAAQPYQQQLSGVLQRVGSAAGESVSNPLLESHDEVRKVLVAVITSDRGLCGGFNNQLLRKAELWVAERLGGGVEVDVVMFGRKGADYYRARKLPLLDQTTQYGRTAKMDLVRPLAELSEGGFVDGTYDEVWLAYNVFVNTITQEPTFQQLLPLEVKVDGDEADSSGDLTEFEYEPSAERLLDALLPLYLRTLLLQAFLETEAGEHAARMTAMDNATNNASDLIDALSLEYNRARQAAITTQIIEIVSGAEALD